MIDCSGKTDAEGKQTDSYYPGNEIHFLEDEIAWWLQGILKRSWAKVKGGNVDSVLGVLSGLKVTRLEVEKAAEKASLSLGGINWGDEDLLNFSREIQKLSKPIIFAANKIDVTGAKENLEKMKAEFPDRLIIPCCAEAELTLRRANDKGLIKYVPGDADFEAIGNLNDKQKAALEFIRENIMKKYSGTGVQQLINSAVFDLLKLIVVYPVEDENKYANHFGKILPDAFLVPKGATALQMAEKVHTDLAKHFIHAVDARKKMRIGKDHTLQDGDIIRIVAAR